MKLHFYKSGLCLQISDRFYPIYPAWTTFANLASLNPKMNSRGRIYFEKLPKIDSFPKQSYNPAEGWLDS